VSCDVGRRGGSDPELLWLWSRRVAIALIRPLAWEPPYAMGAALEKTKRQKKKGLQGGRLAQHPWKGVGEGMIRELYHWGRDRSTGEGHNTKAQAH